MENKTKSETFIGFVMRTGKFRIGTNAVATLKKANLVMVCHTASENTKKQAEKLAKRFACPLLETKRKSLEQLTHRDNAKVMATFDKQLSEAILNNSEEDFTQRI